MTKTTGWSNGLCQDYDARLGRWFADRLGSRYQLRKELEMRTFTVFCEDFYSIDGTTWIQAVQATDLDEAKAKALKLCAEAWGWADDTSLEDAIVVRGVAEGDVTILEWSDR